MKKETSTILPENTIEVRVDDFDHGLRVYKDIQIARIKSEDYSILIMADHMPIIGEIMGTIEFVHNEKIETIENIHAFYMHRNNVLSLLIKEYLA